MAKRLISAGVATVIGILILWLDKKEIFLIAVALVSVGAVYEILVATKYIQNIAVAVISLIFVFAMPFILGYDTPREYINTRYVSFAFIIGLFVIMLFNHKKVMFAQVALVTFVSLCVPFSMTCIIFMFDTFEEHRTFALVYALLITWISDSGAFFAGTFLGKHKMSPNISPKKTWEGFAGGLATAALFGFLLGKGYELVTLWFTGSLDFRVNVLFLSVLAVPCAVFGVLGDFSASILKRECAVKDFGSIMPGHGGILDRFDSVLFVLPFVYLVFGFSDGQYFPVVPIDFVV
ncbi:MAG: phosphatidate cytidylyltransferase [Oscillospiraceae bacterium]|nr:phosphatidate cytidylyltransferase [Oscillospiraceae bacterium]